MAHCKQIFNEILDQTGYAWEVSRERYRATPWYRPLRKWQRWLAFRYFDDQFEFWLEVCSLANRRSQLKASST
jgi:hypothetical protein